MSQLQAIYEAAKLETTKGKVASYIPILAQVDPKHFSVCLIDEHGEQQTFGESDVYFTLQSVVKVISFLVAANYHSIEKMMHFVDVEPTGDSFNSIVRLESAQRKPFNPMINAGAITVASLLPGKSPSEKVKSVTSFLEKLLEKPVRVDTKTYLSEYHSADYNRAIAYILQANGYLKCEVEDALQTYLQLCSIAVTVEDLAKIALFLCTDEKQPEPLMDRKLLKVSKALMLTCGMYNSSGKFAAFVGIPAKSGVSGAIIAIVKNGSIDSFSGAIGIGIYGPAIDEVGNSVAGIHFLSELDKYYDISIF